jgi:hypothetical protein
MIMATKASRRPKFRVGDRVRFTMGLRDVAATVVEDRGPIGVGGRRLFTVSVPADPFEPRVFEMPEDDLRLDDRPEPTELDKAAVIEYLVNGGLVAILASNRAGGANQPRAWLRLDQLGNITHTFIPERGVIGGGIVPFNALHDFERIFKPKVGEVTRFLEHFGLSAQEIERVLAAVGTAP